MADPGLSNRLRQHSRRAGLTVGLSMALTIAICVGGFAAFYAGLSPLLADVIEPRLPDPTAVPTEVPAPAEVAQAAPADEPPEPDAEVAIAAEEPTAAATEPPAEPTATQDAFEPNFQIGPSQSINLRRDASINQPEITTLPPGTPLLYLDEEAPGNDGTTWRRYRTEDGQEGWVRTLDVVAYRE